MGLFCVNFHVRSSEPAEVDAALQGQGFANAITLPATDGWTSFYEEQASHQDEATIQDIGIQISQELRRSVVAFMVHDSDIACYWLFDNGKQVDAFNSCPDYFDDSAESDEARGGDAEILLRYCRPGTSVKEVQDILTSEELFAEQTVEQLANFLGIPSDHAVLDYRDIAESDGPVDFEDRNNNRDMGLDNEVGIRNSADSLAQQFVNAAANGDVETLQRLFDDGVDPNTEADIPLPTQISPLMTAFPGRIPAMSGLLAAVMNGQLAAAKWLCAHGADPCFAHSLFGSPCHMAASSGNSEMLQILIEAGANVQQTNTYGLTPLQTIANMRTVCQQISKLQSSAQALGVKLPKIPQQGPDLAKLESGWTACESLINRATD